MAELYPYPRFSLAERDRRWQAVRELMRQQNLDVIVTPQNSGHSADYQANTRYLTHCGGGEPDLAAVFPLEGAGDGDRDFGGAALADGAGLGDRCARGAAQLRQGDRRTFEGIGRRSWPHRYHRSRRSRRHAHAGRDDLLRHLEADPRSISPCAIGRCHGDPRRSALCEKPGRDRRARQVDGDQRAGHSKPRSKRPRSASKIGKCGRRCITP